MSGTKSRKFFQKGFSLVEFIVVIAIIFVMTGILFVNYNNNRAKTEVEAAARTLVVQMRALQNESLNGKQIGDKMACQYIFNANASSQYSIEYKECSSGNTIDDGSQTLYFNSKHNVNSIAAITVTFNSPFGQLSGGSNQQIILESGSRRASVCVCNSGNIFDQTGSGACGC
jgi:prepilin-type N-terminal cleavage/methylation domain-containing protein